VRNLHRRAYAWGGAAAVLFVVLSWLVAKEAVSSFDSAVISAVQGLESSRWTKVAEGFSEIGSTLGVVLISVVLMILFAAKLGHRRELILLAVSVGGAALFNVILKNAFQRDRPSLRRLIEETGYSFPSGHSMAAFALYGAAAYLLWRHVRSGTGRVLVLGAGLLLTAGIGLSRIYLGVHYPSDVVAGYLASGIWLGFVVEFLGKRLRTVER